jgi:hypothetical protein
MLTDSIRRCVRPAPLRQVLANFAETLVSGSIHLDDLRGVQEAAVQAPVGKPGLDMTLQEMAALEAAISPETLEHRGWTKRQLAGFRVSPGK